MKTDWKALERELDLCDPSKDGELKKIIDKYKMLKGKRLDAMTANRIARHIKKTLDIIT